MAPTSLAIVTGGDDPDFLDLPWHLPLADWDDPHLIELTKGRSRHVVRMVEYGEHVYCLKETTPELAEHERRMLRAMIDDHLPTVVPTGVVTGRTDGDGEPLGAVLITRYLDFSLPYQYLFETEQPAHLRERLLDAAAVLLVRLHTNGVFWGDASLANVLFRRDAGALMAYLVDAETVELHPELTDAMREHDIELARENVAGALLDSIAAGTLPDTTDPIAVVDELTERYHGLWDELQGEQTVDAEERWRIRERIERLQELGFDVEELRVVAADGGDRLQIRPQVVEEGHAHRQLRRLTGLEVQENQARRLLAGMWAHGAWLERTEGVHLPEVVIAQRWYGERYQMVLDAVPPELADRVDGPELFHLFMTYRDEKAAREGRDVDMDDSVRGFVAEVLPRLPQERHV